MAAGLPCISFDCPSGPREIITSGDDGLLVDPENEAALTRALDQLASSEKRRREMGARARISVQRFDIENIANQWDNILLNN